MKETSRSWATAGDTSPVNPHHRYSSALAHDNAGSHGSGEPRRSVGRPFQTPRDGRHGDRPGRPGTLPPVPGRPTFLPAVVAALCVVAFGLLTWQVAAGGPLADADWWLMPRVRHADARYGFLRPVGQFFCDLGDTGVAVPVLAAAVVLAVWRGRRARLPRWWLPPLAAVLAMAAVPCCVSLVKAAVGRPAPGRHHLGPGYPGFYPSGHTATAAVAFGAAALLVLPWLVRAAARRLLVAATVLLNAAVGVSLVWCGYHWALDVLGSWFLCGALLAAVTVAPGDTGRARRPPPAPPAFGREVARAGLEEQAPPGLPPPSSSGAGVSCSSGSPG